MALLGPLRVLDRKGAIDGVGSWEIVSPEDGWTDQAHAVWIEGYLDTALEGPLRIELRARPRLLQFQDLRPHEETEAGLKRHSIRIFLLPFGLPERFRVDLRLVHGGRSTTLARIRGRRQPITVSYEPRFQVLPLAGGGRSGTTILARVLGCHPEVGLPVMENAEVRTGLYAAKRAFDAATVPSGGRPIEVYPDWSRGDPVVDRWLRRTYPQRAKRQALRDTDAFYRKQFANQGPKWVVEKIYPTELHVIHELYPDAPVATIVRDFRDQTVSQLAYSKKQGVQLFSRDKVNTDAEFVDLQGRRSKRIAEWYEANREQIVLVRYEDLVLKPPKAVQDLVDGLGLETEDAVLQTMVDVLTRRDKHAKAHSTTASAAASIGRWETEMTDEMKAAIGDDMRHALQTFGYSS